MPTTFVLDTNVLLHDPGALFAFGNAAVVVPLAVIEEIDGQKRRQDEIGRNARTVSRDLDALRSKGRLAEGVPLPGGGTLRIEMNCLNASSLPRALDAGKADNRILAVAMNLGGAGEGRATLVTKDLNLRLKADVLGIPAEDYTRDAVDCERLYTGVGELSAPGEALAGFFAHAEMPFPAGAGACPNQYFVLRNAGCPSQSALARHGARVLRPLARPDAVSWGLRALNKEQRFALDLLLDDTVTVVTLVGRAGTGKTLLALAAGLEKVVEENVYSRLLITRPVTPLGDDLGYLPGSREEKLRPWMQPIYDNLEFLFSGCGEPLDALEDLMARGVVEMEALTYIRGRSIPRQFILCDEAQNLSPHMVKTLVTRVGRGTKIVFTGDPGQIDHPYLDAASNGLSCLVERLKGETLSGHVTLLKGERSDVAELAARLL